MLTSLPSFSSNFLNTLFSQNFWHFWNSSKSNTMTFFEIVAIETKIGVALLLVTWNDHCAFDMLKILAKILTGYSAGLQINQFALSLIVPIFCLKVSFGPLTKVHPLCYLCSKNVIWSFFFTTSLKFWFILS